MMMITPKMMMITGKDDLVDAVRMNEKGSTLETGLRESIKIAGTG